MNRPGELSERQKAAIARGEELARRAREGAFDVRNRLPPPPPPTKPPTTFPDDYEPKPNDRYPYDHFNIMDLEGLTFMYTPTTSMIRIFFWIKVEGRCDSDAFVQYPEAGTMVSECWHAVVDYKDNLIEDMKGAMDLNRSDGIPNRSNASLFNFLRMRNVGGNFLSVEDYYVRDVPEEE